MLIKLSSDSLIPKWAASDQPIHRRKEELESVRISLKSGGQDTEKLKQGDIQGGIVKHSIRSDLKKEMGLVREEASEVKGLTGRRGHEMESHRITMDKKLQGSES